MIELSVQQCEHALMPNCYLPSLQPALSKQTQQPWCAATPTQIKIIWRITFVIYLIETVSTNHLHSQINMIVMILGDNNNNELNGLRYT